MKTDYKIWLIAATMALPTSLVAMSANAETNDIYSVQQAGQRKISGLLTESNGDPIIGATIRVVGKQGGVVTDAEGRYIIMAKDGDELQYSSCYP